MKKILLIIICVFLLSGCSASYDDSIKMIDKMSELSNKESLFEEFEILGSYTLNETNITYSLIKDGNNYYASIANDYHYIIKNNDTYHLYSYVEGEKIHLKSDQDILTILDTILYRVDINVSLKEAYKNISIYLKDTINKCKQGNEDIICSMEKELFNKIHLEFEIKGVDNKRINKYSLDGGKLMYISSEYIASDLYIKTELKYNYNNIEINDFNKSEYKIKSS